MKDVNEVRIEETDWAALEELRQYEQNSYSYEMAVDAYRESKESENYF